MPEWTPWLSPGTTRGEEEEEQEVEEEEKVGARWEQRKAEENAVALVVSVAVVAVLASLFHQCRTIPSQRRPIIFNRNTNNNNNNNNRNNINPINGSKNNNTNKSNSNTNNNNSIIITTTNIGREIRWNTSATKVIISTPTADFIRVAPTAAIFLLILFLFLLLLIFPPIRLRIFFPIFIPTRRHLSRLHSPQPDTPPVITAVAAATLVRSKEKREK